MEWWDHQLSLAYVSLLVKMTCGQILISATVRGSADNFAFNTYTAFTPEILQWMNELMTKCSAEGKRPANYPMVNSSLAA